MNNLRTMQASPETGVNLFRVRSYAAKPVEQSLPLQAGQSERTGRDSGGLYRFSFSFSHDPAKHQDVEYFVTPLLRAMMVQACGVQSHD